MFFKFRIYNKFKRRKWKKLTIQQRIQALQNLENLEAKKVGRPPYTIVIEKMNFGGLCCYGERKIKIAPDLMYDIERRFYLLHVYFHESRHAYQNFLVNSKKKFCVFSKAYKWKKNYEGPLRQYAENSSIKEYSFYEMQPIERDANLYAIKKLKALRFRYIFDPLFKRTLEHEIESFDNVRERAVKNLGIFYRLKVALKSRSKRAKNKKQNNN